MTICTTKIFFFARYKRKNNKNKKNVSHRILFTQRYGKILENKKGDSGTDEKIFTN
jgi:hypothetical protein